MKYLTGWYGIPGGRRGGRVHVLADGKPMCGAKIHPKAEFQFCAAGIYLPYVECRRCKTRATPIALMDELEQMRRLIKSARPMLRPRLKRRAKDLERYIAQLEKEK